MTDDAYMHYREICDDIGKGKVYDQWYIAPRLMREIRQHSRSSDIDTDDKITEFCAFHNFREGFIRGVLNKTYAPDDLVLGVLGLKKVDHKDLYRENEDS